MRKLIMVTMLALIPVVSQAQAQQSGVSLGFRLGYAPAMGDAFKDKFTGEKFQMSDGAKSQIPIQIDALYRSTPELSVGAYFSYGFGQVGGNYADFCDEFSLDCSARSIRLGVQGLYSFNAGNPQFVPWAGVGIGYEWASLKSEAFGLTEEYSLSGFEFLNLQFGADYKANPQFAVGPYIMYSVGQYSSGTYKFTGDPNLDIFDGADKTIHSWLGFGLRGKFDL